MHPKTRAIIEAELSVPRTIPSMVKTSGLSHPTLCLNVPKLAHIIDWKRSKNKFLAVWELGEGNNAPCLLKPLTAAQKTARYKATRKRRDPLVAALFGTVPRHIARHDTVPFNTTPATTAQTTPTPYNSVENSTIQYSLYKKTIHHRF